MLLMTIKITTTHMLQCLHIISWIIFIGLCIDAGGYLTNTIYALAVNSHIAENFWTKINFESLLNYSSNHFAVVTFYMTTVAVLKAVLFYLIIKLFDEKKIDLKQPFNKEMAKFISNISYICILIGLFSLGGRNYTNWIELQNVFMPNFEQLNLGGADVWIFMGIVLLVLAQIFKRGIEIQQENELTI